jgi:hypothetical protein
MRNSGFPLFCNAKNCSNIASFKHVGIDIYLCREHIDHPVFKKTKSLRLINDEDN